MCADKEHGGRRCPNDTSVARRQRRKASQILKSVQPHLPSPGNAALTSSTVPVSKFAEQAHSVKLLTGSAPPAGMSQLEYDMHVEQKITEFGMALGAEAERIAGFTSETISQEIRDLDNLYNDVGERRRRNEQETKSFLGELNEYEAKNKLPISWDIQEALESITDFNDNEGRVFSSIAQAYASELNEINEDSKVVDKLYDSERLRIRRSYSDKLTAAYQSLIAGIRPVGGTVKHSLISDPEAVELINRTVSKHYPTDWLQHHNEHSEIILRSTSTRPNYNQANEKEGEDVGVVRYKTAEATFIGNSEVEGHAHLLDKINATFPDAPQTRFTFSAYGVEGTLTKVAYVTPDEEIYDEAKHGIIPESERKISGWEHRPSLMSLPYLSTAESLEHAEQIVTQPYWVKKSTTTKALAKVLTVSNDEKMKEEQVAVPDVGNMKEAIAYHEFGHRIEEVMPDKKLTRYERAFLKRRTGKTEKNFNQDMVTVIGKDELYHNSDFVYRYTGRAYPNNNFTEVFTAGIEALYGGNLGGLVGNSNNYTKPDLDHRGFVLGALATL